MALQSWQAGKRVCVEAKIVPHDWVLDSVKDCAEEAPTRTQALGLLQRLWGPVRQRQPVTSTVAIQVPPSSSCQATHTRLSPIMLLSSNTHPIEPHYVVVKQHTSD